MSDEQTNRVRECKSILKRVVLEMEHAVGPMVALPVTMPVLQAIEGAEELCRKA